MQNNVLEQFVSQLIHPVVIETDSEGLLQGWTGDCEWYGLELKESSLGKPIDEAIPWLHGLDYSQPLELPLVSFSRSKTANIDIQPNDKGGAHVFLVDAKQQMMAIQGAQQTNNETALLYEKLSRLSEILKTKNIKLQQAINARSQFLSGVSHEFRTPITAIIGHINWLASHCPDNDTETRRSVQSIDKNAKYLLALIDNLLEQGEITADRLTITQTVTDLEHFFLFIIDTFNIVAKEKQLFLKYRNQFKSGFKVLVDEHHLYLMMVNLISNAIKFTDIGGVEVSAEWADNRLIIKVRDSGIGIPKDELTKIAEPFSRGSNVGHRKGSGLGLSIIHEVVKAMQGELEFHSKLGAGTTVILELPAPKATDENPREKTACANGPVVLIVEDDPDISSLYSILLRDAGMTPICFEDGGGLLENIKKHDPDIIILDYHLGAENGIDLAGKVRQSGFKRPVVLFTATSIVNTDLREKAQSVGCTRVLNKPHDVTSLTKIISSELAKHNG